VWRWLGIFFELRFPAEYLGLNLDVSGDMALTFPET
jgi:hypothetical protein